MPLLNRMLLETGVAGKYDAVGLQREIGAKIERMEERILQADARSQKDSNPVTSVFGELARSGAWSSA